MDEIKKKALVLGAGGFIGSHLVRDLKSRGYEVIGVDLRYPEFSDTAADTFLILDLREKYSWERIHALNKGNSFDEMYQLAADMGGAGYIFTGEHDADIMYNSASINLHACKYALKWNVGVVFYSSSACMYPRHNLMDPQNPKCSEDSAYPANPDSEYGWEKLFSERLYFAYMRNKGLNVRIARFHNTFGIEGPYEGGRDKSPAAICKKVILADEGGSIDIWGDGTQTRSFIYVDECVEGIKRLVASDFVGPVNIGSEEMVTINQLAEMIIQISGKNVTINHVEGPVGILGRNSDNALIQEKLGWKPTQKLQEGIEKTYLWIKSTMESHQ